MKVIDEDNYLLCKGFGERFIMGFNQKNGEEREKSPSREVGLEQ